jgi:hypothetical protein
VPADQVVGSVYVVARVVPACANTYAPGMAELRIEPVTEEQYETLVPMIAAYQGFY